MHFPARLQVELNEGKMFKQAEEEGEYPKSNYEGENAEKASQGRPESPKLHVPFFESTE